MPSSTNVWMSFAAPLDLAWPSKKQSRIAADSIGALMTVLTLVPYLLIVILALGGSTPEFNEALKYVADTLLFAGAALVLASALPRDLDRVEGASVS